MKFKVGPLFHVLIYDIALGIVHVSVMRMKMVNDEKILKEYEMNDKKSSQIGVDILLVYHYLHKVS